MEIQRLEQNYLIPAKLLTHRGYLVGSALLLLCLIDRLSQIDENCDNSKEERFKKFWVTKFCPTTQSFVSECGKYEYYPKGTYHDRAAEIVYALYRSSLVHNGGSLKQKIPSDNCDWVTKLGDWYNRQDQFEIVNRHWIADGPSFCLNIQKDDNGHIEITLDIDKITRKLEVVLKELSNNEEIKIFPILEASAAASTIVNSQIFDDHKKTF